MAVKDIKKRLNYITYGLYIFTTCEDEKKNGLIVDRKSGA